MAMGASATATGMASAAAVGTMTAANIAGVGLSALSAYNQASVAKDVARNNATMAEYAAKDATTRGEKDAMETRRRAEALKSSQRAGLANHGLDIGYGTAGDIQDNTDFFGIADAQTVRDNAAREAWSRRAQGANYSAEANASKPWLAAGGTLLSGAGQVASKWYTARG